MPIWIYFFDKLDIFVEITTQINMIRRQLTWFWCGWKSLRLFSIGNLFSFFFCYLDVRLMKHMKSDRPLFWRKILINYAQIRVNGSFLGSIPTYLNFSQNLFIRFLKFLSWWQALESGSKDYFALRRIIFIISKLRGIGHSWNQNQLFRTYLRIFS